MTENDIVLWNICTIYFVFQQFWKRWSYISKWICLHLMLFCLVDELLCHCYCGSEGCKERECYRSDHRERVWSQKKRLRKKFKPFLSHLHTWQRTMLSVCFRKLHKFLDNVLPFPLLETGFLTLFDDLTSSCFKHTETCVLLHCWHAIYLLPSEFLDVHQDPHQLRDGHSRMGVIQLDGHLQTTDRQR